MKKLILIRHAKSDWNNANLTDFERPLSNRGLKEIKFASKILKKLEIKSDLILCSSATRTRETLEGLWEELDASNEKVVYERGIYDNHSSENLDYYINLVSKIDDDKNVVVLVGHNSFMGRLVNHLVGGNIGELGTLGVLIIDFDIEKWEEIKNVNGRLVIFINTGYYLKR